jgi:hypothetical protein
LAGVLKNEHPTCVAINMIKARAWIVVLLGALVSSPSIATREQDQEKEAEIKSVTEAFRGNQ